MKAFIETRGKEKFGISLNSSFECHQMPFKTPFFYPPKANPAPMWSRGGLLWRDNATFETSRHFDMYFSSPASVHLKVRSVLPQSPLWFMLPVPPPPIWGACCRLSCYVFVYFGNRFQVAIVIYVTWWLMGKIHLLWSPPTTPPTPSPPKVFPSWMNTQREERVPSYSHHKVTHWHPDAHFFQPAGCAFKSNKKTFLKMR